ncbi:ATP synthase F0, B' chain [Neorickettsia risticii str. Illinois]|uniref:ATP synthase F0, B' chain n=1 Tax=Neorickettsia risticii (strain Illinois) TaxID=434131 RepID=C6V4P7_NEORI|nr:ATP synthase F0 subunit B' [Neorickettsia risticii]ACT69372.1 ATP synthase F0, B' chain [Neorickettsia risticii str. Illinois]
MPQFDISTYFGQVFWFSVSFFFLYCFVRFVFVPRLNALLDVRASVLRENRKLIAGMKKDLERLESVWNAALSDARFAAENILRDAVISVEKLRGGVAERLAVLNSELRKENEVLLDAFFAQKSLELEELFVKLVEDYYVVIYTPFVVGSSDVRISSVRKKALEDFSCLYERLRGCR